METTLIDGKKLATEVLQDVRQLILANRLAPKLLIIQVGNDAASTQYISLKKKRAEQVGILVTVEYITETKAELIEEKVRSLIEASRDQVDGIMIQLPLPQGVDTEQLLSLIPPEKDVDGLLLEKSSRNTAVAEAVLWILSSYLNKNILVLGDSPYVGGSIIRVLKKMYVGHIQHANIDTPNIPDLIAQADIVISCIGKPHCYHAKQLKLGAILIDVGTSPDSSGKIVGDFDVSGANGHLLAYTPVPGGVGPLTIAMLLRNLVYLIFDKEMSVSNN